ncbi:MAG: serine/threonine protein kinase [Polyangiaceae bacterium]|nr:serine/threonine protein kinase [Polyangiaceae bacterium]
MNPLIAKRYACHKLLGAGGHGEVWEARDQLNGRIVAVKLLHPNAEFSPARAHLEAAALRLRIPGVVELYDDGVENGVPFWVMERVVGEPFPGKKGPIAWEQLAELAAALLETISQVHAAGVIHRDLKPGNVLVCPDNRIKVLDFGIARRVHLESELRVTDAPVILGTPDYMAPEQFRGAADARTDLYAIGVMLYEALSGKLPFEGQSFSQLFRAKQQKPIPIEERAPNVPAAVAAVVHKLIEYRGENRPRSAAHAFQMLRGLPAIDAPDFRWLGSQRELKELVTAVSAGRSVDVCGPKGVGRTRTLLALAQAVENSRRVVWLTPSEEAFGSLIPLIGTLADNGNASLEEMESAAFHLVKTALQNNVVIVADDAEKLDSASVRVLEQSRSLGSIVRAYTIDPKSDTDVGAFEATISEEPSIDVSSLDGDTIVLSPLREKDLRALFAGPDRLLHLRQDAARALFARTSGLPARVTEEVATWVRLGIARWAMGQLVVLREVLEELESGLISPAAPSDTAALTHLSDSTIDMLVWLTLAYPNTDAGLLARAIGKPLFQVQAQLKTLAAHGLVEKRRSDIWAPRVRIPAAERWTPERTLSAHARMATLLPMSTPGRLLHLSLKGIRTAEDRLLLGEEAAAVADRQLSEGRLEAAMATLERGVRQVREAESEGVGTLEKLFELWADAAISSETPHAMDRILFELCRSTVRSDLLVQLEHLCRAALKREFSEQPLQAIDNVPPFHNPRLERARLSLRAAAAKHLSDPAAEEAILKEIEKQLPADPESAAIMANHWGRLRYRQGRFEEAAALHREAAQSASGPLLATYSSFACALASLDAFQFDDAQRYGSQALARAGRLRHAYYEMLAEWVLRTVAYRRESPLVPDMDLISAARHVGDRHVEGLLCFNEAAVAYRLNAFPKALSLAKRAHEAIHLAGEKQVALQLRCLILLLGETPTENEVYTLKTEALAPLLPGLGIQALALLVMSGHLPKHEVSKCDVERLAAQVPQKHWHRRMDILSVNECLAALQ